MHLEARNHAISFEKVSSTFSTIIKNVLTEGRPVFITNDAFAYIDLHFYTTRTLPIRNHDTKSQNMSTSWGITVSTPLGSNPSASLPKFIEHATTAKWLIPAVSIIKVVFYLRCVNCFRRNIVLDHQVEGAAQKTRAIGMNATCSRADLRLSKM